MRVHHACFRNMCTLNLFGLRAVLQRKGAMQLGDVLSLQVLSAGYTLVLDHDMNQIARGTIVNQTKVHVCMTCGCNCYSVTC